MGVGVKTSELRISGMTCANCEQRIEKKLRNTAGIQKAQVSWAAGTATITYDTDMISLHDICAVIQKLGYDTQDQSGQPAAQANRIIGTLIIIAAAYVLLERFGILNLLAPSQLADTNMGYGMLFVIGLATSVHCVAMCGGINLSQCIPVERQEKAGRYGVLLPSFLYNLGRVLSYTAVGFLVGAVGSVISFSNATQGALKLVAGVFMLIMGINMLGIFPWLRALNPRLPAFFTRRVDRQRSSRKSPLIVGLLNGLMPCGPLQAMQLYALSTGNAFAGALAMFLFSLGTVPLMFGLGAVSSALGRKFTQKAVSAGAVLVAVLGVSMLSQGWSLLGFGTVPAAAAGTAASSETLLENGVQVINSTLTRGRYPAITVQRGVPVKWMIDAPAGSINGCNYRMSISEYGIAHQFQEGENIIEFTPTETGTFLYSCWMGMIRSTITVSEEGDLQAPGTSPAQDDAPILGRWNDAPAEPTPSDYVIPSDELAIAAISTEGDTTYQTVSIDLTDEGFRPAVVVVQSGVETLWIINNTTSAGSNAILVPAYSTGLAIDPGENPTYLYPTESMDFSNSDQAMFGYIKVVDDLDSIDPDAIKAEVQGHQALVWPSDTFQGAGDSCCN